MEHIKCDFIKDKYDNISKIKYITYPKLFLLGKNDIISIGNNRQVICRNRKLLLSKQKEKIKNKPLIIISFLWYY